MNQIPVRLFDFLLLQSPCKPVSVSVKVAEPLVKDSNTRSWSRPRHLMIKPCFHNRKGVSSIAQWNESWRRAALKMLLCTMLASFLMLTCWKGDRTADMLYGTPRNLRVIDHSCSVSQLNTTTMSTINMLLERHLRLFHMHAARTRSIRI